MDQTAPSTVPAAPWKPVGALVFAIIGIIGAIPLLFVGVGYLGGAAFSPAEMATGLWLLGAALTISALAIGIPMTMYLFRFRKRYFVAGLIGFGIGLLLLLAMSALLFVVLTGGSTQMVVK